MSLQITLWMLWTLCIGLVGYLSRRADIVAQHPVNLLGLVIHCVLAGLVGLIAMTMIEMRLEPWRFMD